MEVRSFQIVNLDTNSTAVMNKGSAPSWGLQQWDNRRACRLESLESSKLHWRISLDVSVEAAQSILVVKSRVVKGVP